MLCIGWLCPHPQINLPQKGLHASLSLKMFPCAELVCPHSNPRPHIPICYLLVSLPRAPRSQIPQPPDPGTPSPTWLQLLPADPFTFMGYIEKHCRTPVTPGWALLTEWVQHFCSQTRTLSAATAHSAVRLPHAYRARLPGIHMYAKILAWEAQSASKSRVFPSRRP